MKAWAASTLAENPAAGEPRGGDSSGSNAKSKAQTLLALRRAAKVQLETDILGKKFHAVDACHARHLRRLQDLKRFFLDIPDRLDLEPDDRELVRKEIRTALEQFASAG